MKKAIFKLSAIIVFFLFGYKQLQAQTTNYPVPDISYKVYYFDEKNNEAADMESGELQNITRTRGYGGIGTKESLWQVSGEKSQVRVGKKTKLNFLLKITEPNFDITKEFILLKLAYNPKTKARELVTLKMSSWSEKDEENYETIRYTNSKVIEKKDESGSHEYTVRMITLENLPPGEYVWMRGWAGNGWFFGVD